jgi:hypothetical protein
LAKINNKDFLIATFFKWLSKNLASRCCFGLLQCFKSGYGAAVAVLAEWVVAGLGAASFLLWRYCHMFSA